VWRNVKTQGNRSLENSDFIRVEPKGNFPVNGEIPLGSESKHEHRNKMKETFASEIASSAKARAGLNPATLNFSKIILDNLKPFLYIQTMHNTPEQNLEFQLTFCENNLRHLLGGEVPDQKKIEYMKSEIKRIKKELENFKK
jgi:hypothetical protein